MNKFLKVFLFIALVFASASCGNDTAKKPKDLISQSTMEDILYDLAIVDGARIADPQGLAEAGLSQQSFIFEKYKIDSLQFAESNSYYTSNIDDYLLMYERILKKIETEKTLLDTLVKQQKIKNDSILKNQTDTTFSKKVRSHQIFSKKIKISNTSTATKEKETYQ
jgi:hypothetical protein